MSDTTNNNAKKNSSKEDLDPEMLKNLEVLMDMDLLKSESDWTQMEETDSKEVEK